MNVLEFQRGLFIKRYGIALILTPVDESALSAEIPAARDAIRRWIDRRGKRGHFLRISVLAGPEKLDSFEQILRQLCADDPEVSDALRGRKVTIDFADRRGKKSLRTVEWTVA